MTSQKASQERILRVGEIIADHEGWLASAITLGFVTKSVKVFVTNAPTGHYDVNPVWRLCGKAVLVTANANAFAFEITWEIRMDTNRDNARTRGSVYKEPTLIMRSAFPENLVPQIRFAQAVNALAPYLELWRTSKFHELVGLINEPVRVHLVNSLSQTTTIEPLYEERVSSW